MRVSTDGNPDMGLAQRACAGTVCSRVVQPLASVLKFSGIEPQGVVAPCGFGESAEHDDHRIERHAWYEVLDRSLDLTGDPRIGLRWAKIAAVNGGAMGLVEYLARSSSTLRTAITSLVHYGRVFQDDLAFESVSEGRSVCLRLVSRDNARLPALWAEGILAYWYLIGVRLANFDTSFAKSGTEILFAHSMPVGVTTYQRFFKCPVHFNASEYAIVFASELLDVPLATADACLFGLLESYARHLLLQLPCAGGDVQQRQPHEGVRGGCAAAQPAHADAPPGRRRHHLRRGAVVAALRAVGALPARHRAQHQRDRAGARLLGRQLVRARVPALDGQLAQ
jgi:hypothetical protein